MTSSIDPITFAVIRNGFVAAAHDMYTVFRRTAMLPLLYEFNDFGMSLFDEKLNMLSDAPGLPVFIGSLDICVQESIDFLGGPDVLRPGDVIFNNHPYQTAGQTADAALIEPIFHEDELIGYSALRGHMGDFGAINLYPCNSTDLFQEGTLFPGLKLYERGELNESIIMIVETNSRLPTETAGSILAGAGAVRACSRKVVSIVEKYGIDTYYAAIDELLDQGERATREAIEAIPDGVYEHSEEMDDNGVDDQPVSIRCKVTVKGSDVEIDVSGSSEELHGPFNVPWGYTLTACRFALKRLTTPDLPPNSGNYRPVSVIAPEGGMFNPKPPAPVFCSIWAALRLGDVIVQALAPALPNRAPAESGGDLTMCVAYVADPDTGHVSFFIDLAGLGYGATSYADGLNGAIHPVQAGSESMPAELLEARMPTLKRRFELVQDSGGPGRNRGGLATRSEFEFLGDGTTTVICEKTAKRPPQGLDGGKPAPYTNGVWLFKDTDRELRLGKTAGHDIFRGDTVIVHPAGGGGYGDPLERDPARVAADVDAEYVSLASARDDYGVVLNPETLEVDDAATSALRAELRTAR